MRTLSRKARTALRLAAQPFRDQRRWREILRTPPARSEEIRVFYGVDRLGGPDEVLPGPLVKFERLSRELPNAPRDFNVLYLGSSSRPPDLRQLVWLARRRGAPFVWNQNGVAYPGWAGASYRRRNRPDAHALRAADYVFFQSSFCKLAAERFLGDRQGPWEILPNAVDTQTFTPGERPRELTLLLGGNQYQLYRLQTAFETAALLGARLIVAGALSWLPDRSRGERAARKLATDLGIEERLEFAGPYTQVEAPALLRRASLLLHTKYNDPCPTVVLEAMACGLPVVHSASGGVPELVGEAGIGIPAPLDFDRDHPPDPTQLAAAVERVHASLADYAEAARRRAVEEFDVRPWIARHREVFELLLA